MKIMNADLNDWALGARHATHHARFIDNKSRMNEVHSIRVADPKPRKVDPATWSRIDAWARRAASANGFSTY